MLDQAAQSAHAHHLGVWIAIGVSLFTAMVMGFWAAFQSQKDPDD